MKRMDHKRSGGTKKRGGGATFPMGNRKGRLSKARERLEARIQCFNANRRSYAAGEVTCPGSMKK